MRYPLKKEKSKATCPYCGKKPCNGMNTAPWCDAEEIERRKKMVEEARKHPAPDVD